MTTTRSIRDDVKNVLDYLIDAELALYANDVSMTARRVTWHAHRPEIDFLVTRNHITIEQYLHWLTNGSYSALLRDGSLIQITYDVADGKVVAHRLAYIPCPCMVDESLLEEGHPVADVVSLYEKSTDIALRSPIRFDYDSAAAKIGHPAAHLTINSSDCRIACVAPMHVLRFVDFIYRHLYPKLWRAHLSFFAAAAWRHVPSTDVVDDERTPHITWDIRATAGVR